MHRIETIEAGTPAEKSGIAVGDYLMAINGHQIKDVLDYMVFSTEEELRLDMCSAKGKSYTVLLQNLQGKPLGMGFASATLNEEKKCQNQCVFCFIDQLPGNMRSTLYFKDDDYRMCFLHGNYVTLTNADFADLKRIANMRLSPMNISVHTTNAALRQKMLKNKKAADILKILQFFYEHQIDMQVQIVLCPGLNDGKELEKTLADVATFAPAVISVSIVEVGLTRYRENLYPLQAMNQEKAQETLAIAEKFQQQMLEEYGTRWVFCADEIYIKAQKPIPDYAFYEEFLQYENGVGFIAALKKEFEEALTHTKAKDYRGKTISIATGVSIFPTMQALCEKAEKKFNMKIQVYAVENHFFGKSITVSGLLTATDIIAELKGKNLGEKLLLSSTMLKSGTKLFLDDITVEELEKELHVNVSIVPQDGAKLLQSILKG